MPTTIYMLGLVLRLVIAVTIHLLIHTHGVMWTFLQACLSKFRDQTVRTLKHDGQAVRPSIARKCQLVQYHVHA